MRNLYVISHLHYLILKKTLNNVDSYLMKNILGLSMNCFKIIFLYPKQCLTHNIIST